MSDQLISDGTYAVRGPGGRLTMAEGFPGIAMLPPDGASTQQWKVAAGSDGYTLQSVASGLYLGNDGDPNEPSMIVKGTKQPFTWKHVDRRGRR